VLLALNHTRRPKVLLSSLVNPLYLDVLRTYLGARDVELQLIPWTGGRTDIDRLSKRIDGETACVVLQNPNFFGIIEEMEQVHGLVHHSGALFVAVVDPVSLGVIQCPGEYGADIAVGDGGSLGIEPSFGGPTFGFFVTRNEFKRKLPGRLVGETRDAEGRKGYVLTLQTREQHIRREKATSNICTNQSLMALAATVYLSWLGPEGLFKLGEICLAKSAYAAGRLSEIEGLKLPFSAPFFREFVVDLPLPAERVFDACAEQGIWPGLPIGGFPALGTGVSGEKLANPLLVSFTEKRTKEEIDRLAEVLNGVFKGTV